MPGVELVLERLATRKRTANSGAPSLEVVNQALTDHAFIRHHGLRAYYDH